MENKENDQKASKDMLTFGILIFGSGIATILLFLMSTKNPDFAGTARMMFALTSLFGVAFMIYMKEFRGTGDWKELPIAFRFIWWTILAGNSLNFIEYLMTKFIL
ncbi:hypothetical protein [Priestia aryabhattai]|uniref:hypothetical protein n=1 Tax=Priestia aryabhattai TaxID=412384 RepID=UPI000BFE6E4D|nr:hypothetical protein [Priestia aryabhattai]PHF64725.1 hypothetical protein COI42_26565 [Priestia aryabhattai]